MLQWMTQAGKISQIFVKTFGRKEGRLRKANIGTADYEKMGF